MLWASDVEKLPHVEGETPACPKLSVYNYITLAVFGYCVRTGVPGWSPLWVPESLLPSTVLLAGKVLFPWPGAAGQRGWEGVFPQTGDRTVKDL